MMRVADTRYIWVYCKIKLGSLEARLLNSDETDAQGE